MTDMRLYQNASNVLDVISRPSHGESKNNQITFEFRVTEWKIDF